MPKFYICRDKNPYSPAFFLSSCLRSLLTDGMLKLIFCSIVFLFVSSFSPAQEVNSILLRKAETHFANEEWREAAAMFDVLINESPAVLKLYPYAVAANDLGGDRKGVMAAVELSEKSGIPLDSLFVKTHLLCTALGYNGIYERLLLEIKAEQPWFKRIVNRYLLKFYMERKMNDEAAEIVDEALLSSPDNTDLLKAKAMILADSGNLQGAAECMERVLSFDPTAVEARLFLGNFYFIKGSELYDKRGRGIMPDGMDSVSVTVSPDTADYRMEARSLFLRAIGFLDPDSTGINTPYVRNTVDIIRKRLRALSDSSVVVPRRTSVSK